MCVSGVSGDSALRVSFDSIDDGGDCGGAGHDSDYFDSGGVLDEEEGGQVVDEVGFFGVTGEELTHLDGEVSGQLNGFLETHM